MRTVTAFGSREDKGRVVINSLDYNLEYKFDNGSMLLINKYNGDLLGIGRNGNKQKFGDTVSHSIVDDIIYVDYISGTKVYDRDFNLLFGGNYFNAIYGWFNDKSIFVAQDSEGMFGIMRYPEEILLPFEYYTI